MENKQQRVRLQLIQLVEDQGVRQKFICDKTGIHPSIMCRFKNGQIDMWEPLITDLDTFLQNKLSKKIQKGSEQV